MTTLSLTIAPQSNVLDGITCFETVNEDVLNKLINSTLLKETFHNKHAEMAHGNEKKQLMKYRALVDDGVAFIQYKRREGNPYGRSNPKGALGLFSIRREIRHTLARDEYVDIDVKNCHPVMLLQICKIAGIECKLLEDYVNNRAHYYEFISRIYGVDNEAVKKLFIRLLYGGGFAGWAKEFIKNVKKQVIIDYIDTSTGLAGSAQFIDEFYKEQQFIQKSIAEANPHLVSIVKNLKSNDGYADDGYNLNGSVCSQFLQEYEIRVLEQMYLYCVENDFVKNKNCVPSADGLMIKQKLFNSSIISGFVTRIQNKIGFDLTIIEKAMNSHYTIEDINTHQIRVPVSIPFDKFLFLAHESYEGDELVKAKTDIVTVEKGTEVFKSLTETIKTLEEEHKIRVYYKRKKYFEQYHLKTLTPLSFWRLNDVGNEFNHMDKKTLTGAYEYFKDFIDRWTRDIHIREFEKCDFAPYPLRVNPTTFNMYRGLDCDRFFSDDDHSFDMNKCSIFIKHLWYLVGKNNDSLEYVLNYLAHQVQRPGECPRVSLVFKGVQGCGKSMFFELYTEKVLGLMYLLSTAKIEQIVGRFPCVYNKLTVLMDETSGKDTFINNETIKNLITSNEINYEKKGIDAIKVHYFARHIFLTNNDNSIKIEQTDRRFCAFECSDDAEVVNNTKYIKRLLNAFNDDDAICAFSKFLKYRDISMFDLTNDRPITQFYKETQSVTLPCVYKFFIFKYRHEWVNNESVFSADYKESDFTSGVRNISGAVLYKWYKAWCASMEFKGITEMSFLKKLTDKQCSLFLNKNKGRSGNTYTIIKDKLDDFVKSVYSSVDYENDEAGDAMNGDMFPSFYSISGAGV